MAAISRRTAARGLAATALLPFGRAARAQDYPGCHTIRLVVGYPAGGANDVIGRIFADRLQALWRTTVLVENIAGAAANIGGTDPHHGRREDTGEHYTYIHDPDGNLIELVHHPLGLEDSQGRKMEGSHDAPGLRWTQLPGFVAGEYNDGRA